MVITCFYGVSCGKWCNTWMYITQSPNTLLYPLSNNQLFIYYVSSLPNNRRQNSVFAWELTKPECWCLAEAPFLSRSFWQEVCEHEEGPRGPLPCRPDLRWREWRKSWRRPTANLRRSCQFVSGGQLVEFLNNVLDSDKNSF